MKLNGLNTKQYLGDSVYADYDGFQIWLTTENGLPTDPSNSIALEPAVSSALLTYIDWLKKQIDEHRAAQKGEG